MSSCKGQVFSVDLVVATLVMLLILVSFLMLWTTGLNRLSYFEGERWREEAARLAVGQLVETSGYPAHWNQINTLTDTNIRSVGLTRSRNVLSQAKLDKLKTMENTRYPFVKRLLGLTRYDMRLVINDLDGNQLYYFRDSPPSDKKITTVSRIALLNDEFVEVRIYVWE